MVLVGIDPGVSRREGEVVSHYTTDEHLFHTKLGLDVCHMYEVPPYIPKHCPFRLQPEQFHVIFHTLFQVVLPLPTHLTPATTTFLEADTQSSFMLKMSKRPQSTSSGFVISIKRCTECWFVNCYIVCSGSVVVTTYDFESGRPRSNPEWGPIYLRLRSLHRAYQSLHPFGVVHWVPEQLNILAVTGACKLIDGCSL